MEEADVFEWRVTEHRSELFAGEVLFGVAFPEGDWAAWLRSDEGAFAEGKAENMRAARRELAAAIVGHPWCPKQ